MVSYNHVINLNQPSISHVFEIYKDTAVTTLTLWGNVRSSLTWPLDSQYRVSCRWPIYPAFVEILRFKHIMLMALTLRGHETSSVTWPLNSQYGVNYRWSVWTGRLSRTVFKIINFKHWHFGATRRHQSRHHWTPDNYALSCRWSFETITLSHIVVEISVKHIPVENALIPIFVF